MYLLIVRIIPKTSNNKQTATVSSPEIKEDKSFEEIRKLNVERIRLAHYRLVSNEDEYPEYSIVLAEFRDEINLHFYKHDNITKNVDRINEVKRRLNIPYPVKDNE